jgi:putative nucleotidyltransferase with HDIG domain
MKFSGREEERLKEQVFSILEKGRADWDVPHTQAVVYWIKKLIEKEGGEERILIPAAYLHDIGYSKLKNLTDYASIKQVKEHHMEIGAEIAEDILEGFDFTEAEKDEIIHLILVHDNLDQLSTHNEIILMEADSLAQIDLERVHSTFNSDDKRKYLMNFENKRASKFRTKTGKEQLSNMLPRIKKHYSI